MQNQLSERLAAIETLHARHNAELSAAWTDYADLYGQAEAVKQVGTRGHGAVGVTSMMTGWQMAAVRRRHRAG